ncbi:hypothetical protein [Salinicoccus luteus]|uniref:hypothetical protein n=1 Tax=Salinicoccus luteus TaxID=367840 RepID=UPI0004E25F5E|nr:hypothetical protein [Salinicoccus luteus]
MRNKLRLVTIIGTFIMLAVFFLIVTNRVLHLVPADIYYNNNLSPTLPFILLSIVSSIFLILGIVGLFILKEGRGMLILSLMVNVGFLAFHYFLFFGLLQWGA